jgi:hypothetical protein
VIDAASGPTRLGLFDVVLLSEATTNSDPLEIVTEGCWLALRLGLRVSPVPTGNLRVVGGVYTFGARKGYHPLEATLVGTPATGDWRQDVATTLGVDAQWVSGFLAGFAQEAESSTDGEYVQGFLTAEQFRTARYRRELPDRG